MLIPYIVRLEEAANDQPLNLPAGVSTVPHSIKFTMQGLNAARETLGRLHQITNGFTYRSDGPLKSASPRTSRPLKLICGSTCIWKAICYSLARLLLKPVCTREADVGFLQISSSEPRSKFSKRMTTVPAFEP